MNIFTSNFMAFDYASFIKVFAVLFTITGAYCIMSVCMERYWTLYNQQQDFIKKGNMITLGFKYPPFGFILVDRKEEPSKIINTEMAASKMISTQVMNINHERTLLHGMIKFGTVKYTL